MMKSQKKYKFFFVSDIHNFYNQFIEALNKSGYDENNESHILCILGDSFDRGEQSQKVLDFINSHKTRTILVRGNHDVMAKEMVNKRAYYRHNISNGTFDTFKQLSKSWVDYFPTYAEFEEACVIVENKLAPVWDRMVNYVELKNYIGVHSWIPYTIQFDDSQPQFGELLELYRPTKNVFDPNWRSAHQVDWNDAMWDNPYKMASNGLNQTGKTIISGHWHSSYGWLMDKINKDELEDGDREEYEFGDKANFDIYNYPKGNLIMIDACTAASNKCNVLVIEDEFDEEWLKAYHDKVIF